MDYELLTILLPAFAAGILVLSTHVVLGKQVLKRGIIFIDLAIAQIAALGAMVVHMDHDIAELAYAHVWMPALFALAGACRKMDCPRGCGLWYNADILVPSAAQRRQRDGAGA